MRNSVKVTSLATFDLTHLDRAYSGKTHTCRCGCAGNYTEGATNVKRQLKKIEKLLATGGVAIVDFGHDGKVECVTVSNEFDTREYSILKN